MNGKATSRFGSRNHGRDAGGRPAPLATDIPTADSRAPNPLVLALVATGLALVLFDALWTQTSLITPIDKTLKFSMRALGLAAGMVIAIWFARKAPNGKFVKGLTLVMGPLLVAVGFEAIAWRTSNLWEFGLSRQPFETARYPVKSADREANPLKRLFIRDVFEIDPFDTGASTDIPVPAGQFDKTWLRASDYCIVVEQRRSPTGAIQIRTDGKIMLGTPQPVQLVPCEPG